MGEINPYQAAETINELTEHPLAPGSRQFPYASRWLRLGGAILDEVILAVPLFICLGFLGESPLQAMSVRGIELWLAMAGVAAVVVVNLTLIYGRGQTLGKLFFGTVVVTRDFRRASGNRYLFLRILPMFILEQIPLIGGFIGLADALLIFREEKNCIHDDIAGTRVVMYCDLVGDAMTEEGLGIGD